MADLSYLGYGIAGLGALGNAYAGSQMAGVSEAAAANALEFAKASGTQGMPWDATSPFGKADFDYTYDSGTGKLSDTSITQTLSPELQAEYDRLLGNTKATQEQLAPWQADPSAATEAYYQNYKASVLPQQQAEQLALENRLLAQGMLGSTGGRGRTNALLKAQAQADQGARFQSQDRAQSLVDKYRARAAQDLTQATALGALPSSLAAMGAGQGVSSGSSLGDVTAAMTAAANQRGAAQATGIRSAQGAFNQLGGLFADAYSQY
jgi:hypothetical protein